MELDDLKHIWQQTPARNTINKDIMEIIQHKSYGPVAALKRAFRKRIVLMAFLPFLLLMANLQDVHKVFTSVLFWSYVAFCIGMIIFAYYNYRIASKMEVMDGMVRTNLEHQINLLEKRAKLEIVALRCTLLFFIALIEVLPYFQHYRMLDKWHSLPLMVRISAYAGILLLQYILNRKIKQRKVGRHLDYLKELVNEMQ
ncbi:hypothetical protein [Pontibacter liquoris]|uniref:hypothetical protein n=1 Tax=Pontibacter liquoris TaxID=2905677 RepID=UPI001FA7A629|nr:hypothetical protein [Pontibacter liquoris]